MVTSVCEGVVDCKDDDEDDDDDDDDDDVDELARWVDAYAGCCPRGTCVSFSPHITPQYTQCAGGDHTAYLQCNWANVVGYVHANILQ